MLVVIGIILLLITIALPALNRVRTNAVRTRMAADLQVISMGLEAYKADFKDYPRLDYTSWVLSNHTLPSPLNAPPTPTAPQQITPGAVLLCWALVAPGPAVTPVPAPPSQPPFAVDGADGLGFRTRGTTGQVYGPYIATGRFKVFDVSNPMGTVINNAMCTINDRYGHPILYFPLGRAPNVDPDPQKHIKFVDDWKAPLNQPAPAPTINAHDNLTAFHQTSDPSGDYTLALQRIQFALGANYKGPNIGDLDLTRTALPPNLPYVLWSAGPDENYGPTFDIATRDAPPFNDAVQKLAGVDDVTNLP
ncbi:MAG: hypothetical protein JWN24_3685 [Phycisphaerales bacterium]|nr:hypothetical protein [Phycisphaerales bacterium]